MSKLPKADTKCKPNKIYGSPYEKDVINWLSQGLHHKKISRLLRTEKNFIAAGVTVKNFKNEYFDKMNVINKVQNAIIKKEVAEMGIRLAGEISNRYISLIEKRKSLSGEVRNRIDRIHEKEKEELDYYELKHKKWEEEVEKIRNEAYEKGFKDIVIPLEPRKPGVNTAVESSLNNFYHTLHLINKYVEQFTIRHDLSRMLEGIAVEVSKLAVEVFLKEIPQEKKEFALVEFRSRVTTNLEDYIQKMVSNVTAEAPSFGVKNGTSK
jgi:hypothetical protein